MYVSRAALKVTMYKEDPIEGLPCDRFDLHIWLP